MTKQPKVMCKCGHDYKYHVCLWCQKKTCKNENYMGCMEKKCQCPKFRPTKPLKRKENGR